MTFIAGSTHCIVTTSIIRNVHVLYKYNVHVHCTDFRGN